MNHRSYTRNIGVYNIHPSNLTLPGSQREDWFVVTSYIAEFWCFISNVGFLLLWCYYDEPVMLLCGLASMLAHAIPDRRLLMLDYIAVGITVLKFLLVWGWQSAQWLILLGFLNLLDRILSSELNKPHVHVGWHISATLIAWVHMRS